jgi:predicted transcriptional regulator
LEKSVYYDVYPDSVSKLTEKLLEGLEEEGFFEREGADYNITFKRFADSVFKNWLSGEDLDSISEEEFSKILNLSIIQSDLEGLKNRGVLETIENEEGEPMYFLTEKGKGEMEKFLGKNKSYL